MIHLIPLHPHNATNEIQSDLTNESKFATHHIRIPSNPIHRSFSQASEADRRGRASSSGQPGGTKGSRPAPRCGGGRRKRKDHHRFGQIKFTTFELCTKH